MAKKTVRILRQLPVDGVIYQPDNLVAFDAKPAASYVESGAADDSAGAVKYCKSLGIEVTDHIVPPVEAAEKEADDLAGDGATGD